MKIKKPYNECYGYYYVDHYCVRCPYKKQCVKKAKKEGKSFEPKKAGIKRQELQEIPVKTKI